MSNLNIGLLTTELNLLICLPGEYRFIKIEDMKVLLYELRKLISRKPDLSVNTFLLELIWCFLKHHSLSLYTIPSIYLVKITMRYLEAIKHIANLLASLFQRQPNLSYQCL